MLKLIIEDIEAAGITSTRGIALVLVRRGIRTERGTVEGWMIQPLGGCARATDGSDADDAKQRHHRIRMLVGEDDGLDFPVATSRHPGPRNRAGSRVKEMDSAVTQICGNP